MKTLKLTAVLIIMLLFSCCKSFHNGIMTNKKMEKSTLNLLQGKYEITEKTTDTVHKDIWVYKNIFKELDRKLWRDTINLDKTKKYYFTVHDASPTSIKIDYWMEGKMFKSQTFKAKLKSDGYLYLKNKNTKFLLLPYVFGALDVTKVRLAVDENNDLVFDVYSHRSGAIGVVGFLSWSDINYTKVYQRVE